MSTRDNLQLSSKYAIHWFRRDLRINSNKIFMDSFREHAGRVLGVFIIDSNFLKRDDFSHLRFDFFLETLKSLRNELLQLGSDLLIFDRGPLESWKEILGGKILPPPEMITFNRDYEPFARKRDAECIELFKKHSIRHSTNRDHLIIEPWELLKKDNTPYKVFTPFKKKWLELFFGQEVQARLGASNFRKGKLLDNKKFFDKVCSNVEWSSSSLLESYQIKSHKKHNIDLPKSGEHEAKAMVRKFLKNIENYHIDRDFPFQNATSGFSIFLKNGSLTTNEIIRDLSLNQKKLSAGRSKFFDELIWREFYYYVLYHFPEVETMSFQEKFINLKWENDEELFQSWKDGLTGFPIVDAAMRQLNATGWMHNRLRMIVASFLCKDLLIDYKWGEKYFMEKLLDGDLAANNGGWQWAASTGCDAAPYFRIFNPWAQGFRFDPQALFIKKYIPELRNVDVRNIHEENGIRPKNYPRPIVDHALQRIRALKIYTQR